MLKNWKKPRW